MTQGTRIRCPIDERGQVDLPLLRTVLASTLGKQVGRLVKGRFVPIESTTAHAGRVVLQWDGETPPSAPGSLFFKRCQDECFDDSSEILFYTRDYVDLPDAPIPDCHAGGSLSGGGYWLLLEDLSETHRDNKDVPPDDAVVLGFANSIGRLHCHGWGRAADATEQFMRFMAHVKTGLHPMLAHLGDELESADQALIERVFELHPPRFLERLQATSSLCLLHGDANPTNLLSPVDGNGMHYLIDRQPFAWSLQNGPGAIDLITQSVPFWQVEDRRRHEGVMLDQYHSALRGIDYSRRQLQADYALCLPHALYIAVEWCSDAEDLRDMQWHWQAQLKRALVALKNHGWEG